MVLGTFIVFISLACSGVRARTVDLFPRIILMVTVHVPLLKYALFVTRNVLVYVLVSSSKFFENENVLSRYKT